MDGLVADVAYVYRRDYRDDYEEAVMGETIRVQCPECREIVQAVKTQSDEVQTFYEASCCGKRIRVCVEDDE